MSEWRGKTAGSKLSDSLPGVPRVMEADPFQSVSLQSRKEVTVDHVAVVEGAAFFIGKAQIYSSFLDQKAAAQDSVMMRLFLACIISSVRFQFLRKAG